MNNESEVIDDIEIESELSEDQSQPDDQEHTSGGEEVSRDSGELSEDSLGDTQLGQNLGELITEIKRDEESFQQSAAPGKQADDDSDPFDPSNFSLDSSFSAPTAESAEDASARTPSEDDEPMAEDQEISGDDDAGRAIAQLVAEIESTLQRFTQAERDRAAQLVAEKEAQVAEQYRQLRSLADKVAKQKAQIQEAKRELKAKLELADRLHIEFDGIRQVLNGKLGVLEQLEKEEEGSE